MDDYVRMRFHEDEARRLRLRFAEDWLVRAVVALDLAIRRAALAAISGGGAARGVRRANDGDTPCRS
ncbi:MAG TPA: hypothetical protein VLS49_05775 [Usitatibacter sp.]|nr:hypothetical protein [Usitatibacter sp.]